jgi:hypothetical protein
MQQAFQYRGRKRTGCTLDGDFRLLPHIKLRAHRCEDPLQLRRIKYRWCPATQVNRVHFPVDLPGAHLGRSSLRVIDVLAQATHISFEHGPRKHIGGEVAIAALRPAKRNRNVNSQRHSNDYPTSNLFHPACCFGHLLKVTCYRRSPERENRATKIAQPRWPRKKKQLAKPTTAA